MSVARPRQEADPAGERPDPDRRSWM